MYVMVPIVRRQPSLDMLLIPNTSQPINQNLMKIAIYLIQKEYLINKNKLNKLKFY